MPRDARIKANWKIASSDLGFHDLNQDTGPLARNSDLDFQSTEAPAPGKGIRRGEPDPGNRSADSAVSERDRSPSGRAVSFSRPRGSGAVAARGPLGTQGPDGSALRAPRALPARPLARSAGGEDSPRTSAARVPSPRERCARCVPARAAAPEGAGPAARVVPAMGWGAAPLADIRLPPSRFRCSSSVVWGWFPAKTYTLTHTQAHTHARTHK